MWAPSEDKKLAIKLSTRGLNTSKRGFRCHFERFDTCQLYLQEPSYMLVGEGEVCFVLFLKYKEIFG